ncbi:hypothetical protein N7G274_002612 [Stereocaulon virgatum]|uniref:Uncharacterized protein n=1 Tax=Stereocaulon virgatum TaxID=373712 RepID=A0ABR4AJI8_9LECA
MDNRMEKAIREGKKRASSQQRQGEGLIAQQQHIPEASANRPYGNSVITMRPAEDCREGNTCKKRTRSFRHDSGDNVKRTRKEYDDVDTTKLLQPLRQTPQSTEEPSQFIMANDGLQDCVAPLVTESCVTQLADLFEKDTDLVALDGPIDQARTDAQSLDESLHRSQKALKAAGGRKAPEELHRAIAQESANSVRLRDRLYELASVRNLVRKEVEDLGIRTEDLLQTAMEATNVLKPPNPTPIFGDSKEEEANQQHDNQDVGFLVPYSMDDVEPDRHSGFGFLSRVSESSVGHELRGSPKEAARRAAREKLEDCARYYFRGQAQFDDQQRHYEDNLAEYKRGVSDGDLTFSRSEFDRQMVVYSRDLTGALIDAEAAFENARDEARALHATDSTAGLSYYGSHCETSFSPPAEHFTSYSHMHDWSFVRAWRSNVEAGGGSVQAADVDEWDARTVEISDSLSAIDNERYVRQIVLWQAHCNELEVPSETKWAVDRETLTRRRSL